MKEKLLLFYLLFGMFLFATGQRSYYVSASGVDTNDGLTPATAWQTITKVNASFEMMSSGDSVLFRSGNLFFGTVLPIRSGFTFGAFGHGAKPIITGLTTISSWTLTRNNIWEAVVPGGLATLNMVVMNGINIPMGRYPNANTKNGGYLTYESFVNNASITDNQLEADPDWTGGEMVIRQSPYVLKRLLITAHNKNTLSFTGKTNFNANFGYFIQHHIATLDQNGEWFYDTSGGIKKIKMYYKGMPPPIQVSTLSNLVRMVNTSSTIKSNIIFKGISFQGCEGVMIQLTYCSNVIIDSCDLSYAGVDAIDVRNVPYLTVTNSAISNVNMIGIHQFTSTLSHHVTIKNNIVRRIGIYPGMISGDAFYNENNSNTAMLLNCRDLLVEGNVIDSTGYNGITLSANRNNQVVRKNIVSNFNFVKNDGAGIYNSGLRGDPVANNIVIDSNIVSKAIGAGAGTMHPYQLDAPCIYLDASSNGVQVLNNIIFEGWSGIYISQSQNIIIKGNTIYNTGNYKPGPNSYYSGALAISDVFDGFQHTRNNIITNNIFFAKNAGQLLYYQIDRYNTLDSIGIIDSNYYASPFNTYPVFLTNTTAASVQHPYSLETWKSKHPVYEKHSKSASIEIPRFTINGLKSTNKFSNEFFKNNISGATAESSPKVHTLSWDNTGKITGAGSLKLVSGVTSSNFTSLSQVVGPVDSTKKYVVRFKTKATKTGSFLANIRQYTGCYCVNSPIQAGNLDTGIQQHELLLSWDHASQTNAAVFIQFSQDSSTVYIDDMQFYEVNATQTSIDDYVRFEYNPTNLPKVIELGKYPQKTLNKGTFKGSYILPPFTAVIFTKDISPSVIPAEKNE